jgi:hypothetical protein
MIIKVDAGSNLCWLKTFYKFTKSVRGECGWLKEHLWNVKCFTHIENDVATKYLGCTDGSRMMLLELPEERVFFTPEIKEGGVYRLHKCGKEYFLEEKEVELPDFTVAIPSTENQIPIKHGAYYTDIICSLIKDYGVYFDIGYFYQFKRLFGDLERVYRVYDVNEENRKLSAWRFDCVGIIYVVMPRKGI